MKPFASLLLAGLLTACAGSTGALKPVEERTFPVAREAAYSAAIATIVALGWQVTHSAPSEGIVTASTPVTMSTFGDNVTVHVVSVAPGQSRVDVTSATPRQVVDWGKNRENVERFYSQFTAAIRK
jgi:hypothetical protein